MQVSFSLDVSDLPLADAQIDPVLEYRSTTYNFLLYHRENFIQSSLQMHLPEKNTNLLPPRFFPYSGACY